LNRYLQEALQNGGSHTSEETGASNFKSCVECIFKPKTSY